MPAGQERARERSDACFAFLSNGANSRPLSLAFGLSLPPQRGKAKRPSA